MVWKIEFDRDARKELAKLGPEASSRILKFLIGRLAERGNPRDLGEALHGPVWGDYWKYRVGDYRVLCKIIDKDIIILVIRIGNHREVYR